MKEFVRLVDNYEKAWKIANDELEIINLGIKQEEKDLKIGTLITTKEYGMLMIVLKSSKNMEITCSRLIVIKKIWWNFIWEFHYCIPLFHHQQWRNMRNMMNKGLKLN